MNLEDINKKLEEISKSLDTIDYAKELKDEDAKKVTDKINNIDNLITQDGFGKDKLDDTVKKLDELYKKAEDGANKIDVLKESSESINNKTGIRDQIKSKYDDLFKQKEIIDKYVKDYDPNYIIDIKEDKIKSNNDNVENKKNLIVKIQNFKNKEEVKDNLDKIENINKINKVINDAINKTTEIKKLEDRKVGIKDPTILDNIDTKIGEEKNKLKETLCAEKISYDDNMLKLKASLQVENNKNKNRIIIYANKINTLLNAEKDTELKDTLKDLTKNPSKILETFDDLDNKIYGDIIKLNTNTRELQADLDLMKEDLNKEEVDYLNSSSKPTQILYKPTDDEIENDPDYKLVPVSKEDKANARKSIIQARKKVLCDKAGINIDDKGLHPIIWFKSHFATKKLDEEIMKDPEIKQAKMQVDIKAQVQDRMDYLRKEAGIKDDDKGIHPVILAKSLFTGKKVDDQILKEKIKAKLIQEKQNKETDEYKGKAIASKRKDNARTRFVDELTREVVRNKGINEHTAVSKAYHKAEEQKYNKGR